MGALSTAEGFTVYRETSPGFDFMQVLLHELRIGGADLIVVAVVLGDAVYTALHSVAYSFALDIPSRFQTPG
ncbi:MAG: hypothetical protein EBT56_15365 [Betaproteobacteria bacterium]|nr:hypothetical protein [Betaproteobacteria bacterium]